MSCQRAGVRKNAVITDDTVVRYMTICLNKTILPYYGFIAVFRTPVDSYTFADCRVIADLGRRNPSFEFQTLGSPRGEAPGQELTIFPSTLRIYYISVRAYPRAS